MEKRSRTRRTKLPALLLYVGDWLKDPALGLCAPSTRGIWIDCICLMFENDRSGLLRGTVAELAQVCRCAPEAMRAAILDLRAKGAATVMLEGEAMPPAGLPSLPPPGGVPPPGDAPPMIATTDATEEAASTAPPPADDLDGVVTLINRRMYREHATRKWAAFRQRRKYARAVAQRQGVAAPAEASPPSSTERARPAAPEPDAGAPRSDPPSNSDPPARAATGPPPKPASAPPIDLGRAKPAVMSLVDRHRDAALRIFAALDLARRRLRPRSGLQPSYDSLAGIAGRLEAGKTEAQCLHVLAVYAAEAEKEPAAWRYFDAVSPWRPDNFERALGRDPPLRPPEDAGVEGTPPATSPARTAFPYRMPNGAPWPREIDKVIEALSPDAARERIDFLRRAEPFRYDDEGNARC